MDRVEAQIQARGLNVFARIDHAAGAAEVGLPLAPTDLIIFGNARGGTPLMQSVQTVGIDLPLKILVSTAPRWVVCPDLWLKPARLQLLPLQEYSNLSAWAAAVP